MNASEASRFWEWFASIEGDLRSGLQNDDASRHVRELDARLRHAIDGARWEIGPEGDDGWFFALGLRADLERLPENEAFIALAPKISTWTFRASKPPKEWDRKLRYGDRYVDFDRWHFDLRDGVVAFDPSAESLRDLSADEREGACWLFVEGELGELEALSSIYDVVEDRQASGRAESFVLRWRSSRDAE